MSRQTLIRYASILTMAVVGLALIDNVRPWRRLQLEFHQLERVQLHARLETERASQAEQVAELEARIESQETLLESRRDEITQLEDDLRRLGGKARAAEWRRSRLEAELSERRPGAPPEERSANIELTEALRQARIEVESFAELMTDRENQLAAIRADLNTAREELVQARAPIVELEARLTALPQRPWLPLRGLFAPGVKVHEIKLPASDRGPVGDHQVDQVDRCVTCHLAAPRDDLAPDDWPAHLKPHPNLDLYVGPNSPHPYAQWGCTACHGGEGRATDFSRAGHRPTTPQQAAEWRRDWGWQPKDGAGMLPLDGIEASCGRCHHEEISNGQASPVTPDLDRGRRLIATLGCSGCHVDERTSDDPKVGPSLVGLAGKTTPAWVHRWLESPQALRASSRMPHFFASDPQDEEAEPRRRSAEIRAIVDYLWHASQPAIYEPSPTGESEDGRILFETIGCQACHLLSLETSNDIPDEKLHGPHLAGLGSKVTADWLYAWLRDPRSYRHDTPMPSLRLDEQEAADLTAYLMSRRDPAWEGLNLPEVDVETRDQLLLAALERSQTIEQSQARFERMSERDKNIFLGEQTIARYGCHGCHEIAGIESELAVGRPLAQVARQLRERFTSAESTAETTAEDRPETADDPGLSPGHWQAALHQPAYDLDEGDRRAVTVALVARAFENAPPTRSSPEGPPTDSRDSRAVALAQGRQILARYNCRGCHRIEGQGGSAEPAGDAFSPSTTAPDLLYAGTRLKATWLHPYLADPGRQVSRPWLQIRMPTFGLTEAEKNSLVHYFAALDDQPILASEPGTAASPSDIAVGRVVFDMLQCVDCHQPPNEESMAPQLAPNFAQTSDRLRADWVADLILDPERWLPGTSMPANFRQEDGEELSSSFLIGSINTPIFAVDRDRLRRLLGSEEELQAYLSDPERVAAAVRDYLWTLGN